MYSGRTNNAVTPGRIPLAFAFPRFQRARQGAKDLLSSRCGLRLGWFLLK